jgi:periplasmic divalent cation tolerance protein
MTDFVLVYVTCKDTGEAEKVGRHLLQKRLCACINIFPKIQSVYWWPPKENRLETAEESVLVFKALAKDFSKIEAEIVKVHSYGTPCIIALPIANVSQKYLNWTLGEIKP